MTENAKQVEDHFHRTSRVFNSFYDEKKGVFSRMIDEAFRKSMRLRYEKVIDEVAPYEGKTILDVGCGSGRYCIALAEKGVQRALGIDFAENMIEEAILLSRAFDLSDICQFEKRDFMEMNAGETFDHVFAMGVLDYIEKPVHFVKKMFDAAKRTVMISFPAAGGLIQRLRKFKFERLNHCPVYFYSRDDVERIARDAGAQELTIAQLAKDFFLTIRR